MEKKWINKSTTILMLALIATALWGSAYPTVKLGMEWFGITPDDSASKLLFAGVRFLCAGLIVIIFSSIREKRIIHPTRKELPQIVTLGIVLTSLQEVLYCIGLANTSATKSAILSCSGAFLAVLSAPILVRGERLSTRKIVGCLIGFIGVVVVNGISGLTADTSFTMIGEGCVLLSALAFGLGSAWSKTVAMNATSAPTTVTGYEMLIGGALICLIGPFAGGKLTIASPYAIPMMCYLSVLSALAFSLWTLLLKHNDVGKVAVYNFLVPIFGTAFSGLVLKENIFTAQNLIALALVSAGVIIVNLHVKSRDKLPTA